MIARPDDGRRAAQESAGGAPQVSAGSAPLSFIVAAVAYAAWLIVLAATAIVHRIR